MNIIKFEHQKQDLEMLRSMASIALRSEKYEGYNEATILNIFLTARALGVDPMLALNGGFNIIKGKINMGAHFMAALARRAGHSIKVVEMTDQKCTIVAKRKDNDDSLKYEMTMGEAANAGLVGKQNWRTNPKQMLYCACVRNVFRILFSDIAIPYDADEMNVEDTVTQAEDVGLSEIDPVDVPALDHCVANAEPACESVKRALEIELMADEIPVDKLEEWVSLRAQTVNKPIGEVYSRCLRRDTLPKFKEAFVKWLELQSQPQAV